MENLNVRGAIQEKTKKWICNQWKGRVNNGIFAMYVIKVGEIKIGLERFIRVGVFSDTHCGHVTGLTHPDYNSKTDEFHSFRKRIMGLV